VQIIPVKMQNLSPPKTGWVSSGMLVAFPKVDILFDVFMETQRHPYGNPTGLRLGMTRPFLSIMKQYHT
jgi:hypothetical protein